MSLKINLGEWGSVFAVPVSVVDEHLKLASPNQLKLLLFLLRNSEKNYSNKEISDILRIHEADIDDCIQFWVQRGLIVSADGAFEPKPGEPAVSTQSESNEPQQVEKPKKTAIPRPFKPDIITARQRMAEDSTLNELMQEVESALSKTLSGGDISTIVMLYDTCGLPPEVIALLVNYCVSVGKANIRAIERIGIKWSDEGVNTIEAADKRIEKSKRSGESWARVSAVFGMSNAGSATEKQLEFADRWIEEWKFSDEMLRIAYEKCLDSTGKFSMGYINKILERWHKGAIFTPDDVSRDDNRKPSAKTAQKASYDISMLEKIQ